MELHSANFRFLDQHDPQLVKLAALAEHFVHSDSNTCIIFHAIRIAGNKAVHNSRNADSREALTLLKNARQLGIWFHRTFKDKNFKAGSFVPPAAPIDANAELQAEIVRLRAIALDSQSAAERS
ncbi:MAG TPA: hypothetical protein DCZ88_01180 [Pseudanabaena sp.]|nr:hypothetical protein [Pseudanabaena sp.]